MQRGIFVLAVLLIVSASSVYAAQKGPKSHQPKTVVPKAAVKVHAKPAVKTHVKPATKTHVKPATKTHLKTNVKTTKVKTTTTTKAAKAPKAPTAKSATTTAGPIVTLSPVQQKLQRNTNLAAKLQGRLPAGTDLMAAAAGFRNLGQFVSTVNASHNHELSFIALKTRIVGQGMSLGQAMQDLR